MRFVVPLLLSLVLAACADGRCSVENCRKLSRCDVQLALVSDNLEHCTAKGLRKPAGYDESGLCTEACHAVSGGETVQCLADLAPQCDKEMNKAALATSACFHTLSSRTADASCLGYCELASRDCFAKCPGDAWDACAKCAKCANSCGAQWAECENRC